MDSLETAYKELERISLKEKHTHSLSEIFKKTRDEFISKAKKEDAQLAQYEIDYLNFNISENKLSFLFSGTNDKGEPVEYPSINSFTKETYNYLKRRQKESKAENLKARYSHILWLSPEKNIEYAQTAIDNYLKLINIREKQDDEFPDQHFGLKVLDNVKNSFLLSLSVNYKTEENKEEILRLVHSYSNKSSSSYALKFQLIELMLKNKKVFKNDDFEGIVDVCESMIEDKIDSSKHSAIDILNLIIRVLKKLNEDTKSYKRRVAELWEALSVGTNLVSTEFCKNAINIYKELKDNDKVKELEARFNTLRKNIKLSEFGIEIDLSEMMAEFRKYADKLSDNEPFVIINSLMNDKGLLPTLEEVKKQAKETNKNSFLSTIGNTSILDRNGNTAQYFNDPDEYEYYEILQSYKFSLELSKSHLIREILIAGIKKGKLTSNTILFFLKEYSWLGKELELSTNGEKSVPYTWLALIAPSLNEYFINLEFYFRNNQNTLNFILCIDSLSLKIEGMLRDICEFNGITTFDLKPDKKGRTISQEKDIHRLLYEPELVNIIDQDDLLFFKFLLIEKAGYNLRHRIAHSLMTYYDYQMHLMNLLLMAVLKFGKYNFVTKKDE